MASGVIALFFLQATLGAIGQQALPDTGCAAYLWSTSDRQLIAMATAEPGRLRLMLDGKPLDLARTGAEGVAGRGLATTSRYAAGDVTATLELTVAEQTDMTEGARVPQALLTVERAGKDMIVTPVAGLVGCAEEKK